MKIRVTTALLAIFTVLVMLLPAPAGAVTERMKRDCRADYNRYCKKYQVGSEGLRACMSRSIRKVSNRCINALVSGGEMTKGQAERVRRQKQKKK